jgi:hypothetical protein
VKYILAAGAVATALGAIIGLGRTVLPDSPKPPERQSATISTPQVDQKVPLAEYLEDTPAALRGKRRTASVSVSVSKVVFASASIAQSSTPTVVSPPPATTPQPPSATTPSATTPQPPSATTPQSPSATTPQSPSATTPQSPSATTPQPPSRPPLVAALIAQVEKKPLEEVVELPETTARMQDIAIEVMTDDKNAPRAEVRTVLASSRLQLSNASGSAPKLSPLGVVVNFVAEIEGYRGKQSVVRWSLFDAREGTRMPQSWLRNREALRLVPEAGSDRGSLAVWVPLPRKRGPYFVRLELFDDRGGRLEKRDTKSFDR